MAARGQKSGQESGAGAPLDWPGYIDALIAEHGSLAALADRMAALRSYREDVESVSRALRRLRTKGTVSGGVWGDRLLRDFGLPKGVDERLRFMGQYHSRFVDLPLPLCTDLVLLWDRPPTSQSREGRLWLSLARATLALRCQSPDEARTHLETAVEMAPGHPAAEVEVALALSVIDSRTNPREAAASVARVPELLAALSGAELDCLLARYTGQLAYALNHRGQTEKGLALHLALPDTATTHPFARSRRANGIAYGYYRAGALAMALESAERAATFAGDAGHVRLRAMALLMIARIGGNERVGVEARERARVIAQMLAEPTLLSRVAAADRDS